MANKRTIEIDSCELVYDPEGNFYYKCEWCGLLHTAINNSLTDPPRSCGRCGHEFNSVITKSQTFIQRERVLEIGLKDIEKERLASK